MRRGGRDADLRVRGISLGARFALSTTAALALVMVVAALVLFTGTNRIARNVLDDTLSRAVKLSHEGPPVEQSGPGTAHANGVERFPVRYGAKSGQEGMIYRYRTQNEAGVDRETRVVVPLIGGVGRDLLGMIAGIMVMVVLVGAGVALWAAQQVSRPIHRLVDDVRTIAKGNLEHKTRAVGVGEVELLARSIDRMTRDLSEAQNAQVELSVREREMDLAGNVREALLPLGTPHVPGYPIGAARLGAHALGGDFHDFVEHADGRVGVLVCDVSGHGVPAALIGATARSYLRSELQRDDDPLEAFQRVNRWLAQDVRRGMFVTALYLLVDPSAAKATVLCAGHKIPLLRYCAEDKKLRIVHPEGIAFGFDKGPVFERRLEAQEVPIEVGDRLFLSNSSPVAFTNAQGRELGEKAYYGRVLKHAALETTVFLRALKRDLEHFVGGEGVPADVSLVTLSREG